VFILKKSINISEAELEILEVLWKEDKPLSIQEVCDGVLGEKWKYNTVGTMLLRLAEKGVVTSQKENRIIYYSAVLKREEYKKEQTNRLVSKLYGGSVRELAVSLLGSEEMTAEDLEKIRKMFSL